MKILNNGKHILFKIQILNNADSVIVSHSDKLLKLNKLVC